MKKIYIDEEIELAIANSNNVTDEMLSKIVKLIQISEDDISYYYFDLQKRTQKAIANNDNASDETLHQLANAENLHNDAAISILNNKKSSIKTLKALSKNENISDNIRFLVEDKISFGSL